jgi:hypothetical protein
MQQEYSYIPDEGVGIAVCSRNIAISLMKVLELQHAAGIELRP